MTTLPVWQVDAFSSTPFGGNPAAVTLLEPSQSLSDELRLKISAEMNLAETAFIELMPGGDFSSTSDFILRWFTPTTEVPMCGHATLASAAVLFQELKNQSDALNFHTKSGILTVRRSKCNPSAIQTGALLMDMRLPISYTSADNLPPPLNEGLDTPKARQLITACVGDLEVSECVFCDTNNLNYLVIRLPDGTTRQQLEGIVPDMQAMMQAANPDDVHGVIVTCTGGDSYDFLSRFFGPWLGVPEDPVTGSAHSVLGPFWSSRLQGKGSSSGVATGPSKASAVGKPIEPMKARQCSPRGGDLLVSVYDSIGNVQVTGSAVVVLKGNLMF